MPRRTLTASLAVLLLLPALLRADDAPKGDKDLEGEWEAVSAVHSGMNLGPPAHKIVMTFECDAFTLMDGDKTHTGKVKVDASKTPKEIDLVADDGPDKGQASYGVYEIRDDELRLCAVRPGKNRPTELSSKAGSGLDIMTLKRVKK